MRPPIRLGAGLLAGVVGLLLLQNKLALRPRVDRARALDAETAQLEHETRKLRERIALLREGAP